jgi:hypothetical protein
VVKELDAAPALTASELGQIVRGVDPTAFVVPGRVVRRAIKHDRGLPKVVFRMPHRLVYAIKGTAVLEVVERDELGLEAGEAVPATVILLAEPEPNELDDRPRAEVLRHYWRRLFHARVDVEVWSRFTDGTIDRVGLRERIRHIGPSAFEEARTVLEADNFLLPPIDDAAVYIEFASVYLGLRAFSDHLIPQFFPAIRDFDAVDRTLAEDIDTEAVRSATRLPGAAEAWRKSTVETPPIESEEPDAEAPSGPRYRRLMTKADLAFGKGNMVRAAILRTQAARLAGSSAAGQARSAARDAIDWLAGRLRAALEFDEAGQREWRKALLAPLEASSRGSWTVEARLLYDFQKVCLDHERPFYALDLFGWATSFGRKPLKRTLPHHDEALLVQHLRAATKNLAASRLPEGERDRFIRLLSEALHRAEDQLRDRFRPEIGRALEQNGFEARNLPERVALQKLNEELLDRVVHRGFLSMGDLRDAVSRNNRKLPDLAGPVEFFAGDRLLRVDRRLSIAMDGIYRGGEVYLRFLQRMSALAFGTRTGRLFTRYIAMPYGGAFVALEGLQHIVGPISHFLTGHEIELLDPIALAIDGTVAIGLINSPEFRLTFGQYIGRMLEALHRLIFEVPRWLLRRDWIRRVLGSRTFKFFWRGILLPLSFAGLAWAVRPSYVSTSQALAPSALIFFTACLVLNTRAGRDLEEMTLDSLGRAWHSLISNVLPGLFRLVMDVFARVMEAVERALYTVDEWLRFRGGQMQGTLASKAVLGMAWILIAYVFRFFITLLIEPQINPIKHFPVVTVSAKILVTQVGRIVSALETILPPEQAKVVSGIILLFLPGVFGFLVWELKENWRLYEANRPWTLRPVVIGHHGETMMRLLKPGFNSGTVPKVFAKLRRAERKALWTGRGKHVRKQLAHLHAVEEEVRHFIDRDFLTLLLQGRSMASMPLAIGEVVPGAKRFLIEIVRPGREGPGLWLSIEEHSGWIVAGVDEPGWLSELSPEARESLGSALAGLYKMAGVDLVREPIARALGPDGPSYDFREQGLIVWPDDASNAEFVCLFRPESSVSPMEAMDSAGFPSIPLLDPARLLFSKAEITWARWVEVWDRDQAGAGPSADLVDGLKLLPEVAEKENQLLADQKAGEK